MSAFPSPPADDPRIAPRRRISRLAMVGFVIAFHPWPVGMVVCAVALAGMARPSQRGHVSGLGIAFAVSGIVINAAMFTLMLMLAG